MGVLQIIEMGLLEYPRGLEIQEYFLMARQQHKIPDTLFLLEHPPVITIGRQGGWHNILTAEDRLIREGIRVYESNRGGDVTYHGPGQLVGYPIVSLEKYGKDVHAYYFMLEQVFINLLADFGLQAGRNPNYPGVWVNDKKIVAIGIAVKKWVTMHGFALNVCPNLKHYEFINPCGIRHKELTSLQENGLVGVTPEQVQPAVIKAFCEVFGLDPVYTTLEECQKSLCKTCRPG